jgi:uncharacterized membrane protein YkoI
MMGRWLATIAALGLMTPLAARVVESPRVPEAAEALTASQKSGLSLAQATALALRMFPGRVVRAETVSHGGRREHQIRILGDDGRVRNVRVDATTGQIL